MPITLGEDMAPDNSRGPAVRFGSVPRPALFLDRDGVINEEVEYLSDPARVSLIPGAAAAIAQFNAAGIPVVVVTNQSGLARGLFSVADLAAVTARLSDLLAADGARLDASYHCPHHPSGSVPALSIPCLCRKPGIQLLLDAARDLDLDLSRSALVGDKPSDLGAARAAGCLAVLVRTGYGAATEREATADATFDDLYAATSWLLERMTAPAR
jgi:D-glycero-D-manno-heptose 1,7-bisphosphate phosphatase